MEINRLLVVLALCAAVPLAFASSPAIGLVAVNGSLEVDHSRVWGTATLFDGNLIETGISASHLQLQNGVSMRLASDSRARVYQSRLVLEKGIGQLESLNYRIEAASLRVTAEPGAIARVQLAGPNRVIVAARNGSVHVSNNEGVLVAALASGREMSFEPQAAGASAPTKVSGCLVSKDGKFIVVDRTTNVTMEVQGTGLTPELGNQVEITGIAEGTPPTVAGASQLITATSVNRVAKGGCASVAKKLGTSGAAAGAAAGATAAGLSTGATVAIIGGVAAAGTVGGLAAEDALPGQGGSKPANSR